MPMTDALGFRKKFGVIAPSTNTSVQPEFEAMRPRGVTNHFGRIYIPNDPIRDDDDFNRLMDNIRKRDAAGGRRRDDLRARLPDHGHVVGDVLGRARGQHAAAASGWRRAPASRSRWARTPAQAALNRYGARRLAVITPYMPVGDAQVRRFFADCGFEVVRLKGLKCASPVHDRARARSASCATRSSRSTAPTSTRIMQVGTNLAMARLAGIAEFWLDKPVLAINTCIYWWALRQNGIDDKIDGFGSLLLEH